MSIHKPLHARINDSLKAVVKNLQLFKPDYIYLVPAFLELFYSNIMRTLKKQGKDKLVFSMIEKSNKLRKVGIDMRKALFGKITENFGGNLKKIVCGGRSDTPRDRKVLRRYRDLGHRRLRDHRVLSACLGQR